VNAELQAVRKCRNLVEQFVAEAIDYGTFVEQMASAMGPLDPLDWAIKKLDAESGKEATMYSEWLGGAFGETEDRIPRRPEWRYGECTAPYGWVDESEYRNRLREAFAGIIGLDT
jgi:hypothetical protein